MIDTFIHLGTATTNFAIDQMGNALRALVRPAEAMDHMKDTLLNLSDAMNRSAASSRRLQEWAASDLDGMEDASTQNAGTPFVDVRRPTGTPEERVRMVNQKVSHPMF